MKNFILLLFAIFATALGATTLNESLFEKKAQITVRGYHGVDELTDMPVLVRIKAGSPLGFTYGEVQSGGSDLRFADSEGNLLSHEIENWTTKGESHIWVKLPHFRADAVFYMYWKSRTRTLPYNDKTQVWTAYDAVWHMNEYYNGGIVDATGNGHTLNNGTPTKITGDSEILPGPCVAMVSGSSTAENLHLGSTFSLVGWFRYPAMPDSLSSYWGYVWGEQGTTAYQTSNQGWYSEFAESYTKMGNYTGSGGTFYAYAPTSMRDDWHQIVMIANASANSVATYFDGGQNGSSISRTISYSGMSTGKNMNLAREGARCDEVRVVLKAISSDRMQAEYETIAATDYLEYGMASAIEQSSGPLVVGPTVTLADDGCGCNFILNLASPGLNAESVSIWYARTRADGSINDFVKVKEDWSGSGTPFSYYDYLPVESDVTIVFRFVNNLGATAEVTCTVTTAEEIAAEYGAAGVWEKQLSGYANDGKLTDTQRHTGTRKTTFYHAYAGNGSIPTTTTFSYSGYFYLTEGVWSFWASCDDRAAIFYYDKNRTLLNSTANSTIRAEIQEGRADWYYMDFRFSNNGGPGGSSDGAGFTRPDGTSGRFRDLTSDFCRSDLDYWVNIHKLEKSLDGTELNAVLEYFSLTNVTIKAVYGDAYMGIDPTDAVTLLENSIPSGRVAVAVNDIPATAKYLRFFAIPNGFSDPTDFIWGKTLLIPDVDATSDSSVALVSTEMTSDATCDLHVDVLSLGSSASCDLYVAYGLSPDNLFATNFLASGVTETGELTAMLAGVLANRDYYLQLFTRDANGEHWDGEIFTLNTYYDSDSNYGGRLGLIQCRYANRTTAYGSYDFFTGVAKPGSGAANANNVTVAPGPMAAVVSRNSSWLIGATTYYNQGPSYSYAGFMQLTTNVAYYIGFSYDDHGYVWVDGVSRGNTTFVWNKPTGWYEIRFWFDDSGGGTGGSNPTISCRVTDGGVIETYSPWKNTNDKTYFRADRPPREVTVKDFDAEDGNLNVRFELEQYDTNTLLYCCWGALAGGTTTDNWDHVEFLGDYDTFKHELSHTVGSIEEDGVRAARFVTWQYGRGFGWSSTVSLGDAENPMLSPTITEAGLENGDDVTINGKLLASGEREGVTVTVYWSTNDTDLAAGVYETASVIADETTGEWSIELYPVPPEKTVYYYVEAAKGPRSDRSATRSFITLSDTLLSQTTECLNSSQRIFTFRGSISKMGARTTTISLWLGKDYGSAEVVATKQINASATSMDFEFVYDVSSLFGFDEEFVYFFTVDNSVPSRETPWHHETMPTDTEVLDLSHYRWTGLGQTPVWTSSANWTNLSSSISDALGYPCRGSTAIFPSPVSNETYEVRLDEFQKLGVIDVSATNLDVRIYTEAAERPQLSVSETKTAAERKIGVNSSVRFDGVNALFAGGIEITSSEQYRPARLFVSNAVVTVDGETLTWGYPAESGVWIYGENGCFQTARYYPGAETGSNYVCNAVFSVPSGGFNDFALKQLESGSRPFADAGATAKAVPALVTVLESSPAYDDDGIVNAKLIDWNVWKLQPSRVNLSEYPKEHTICDAAAWFFAKDPDVTIKPAADFQYLGYTIDGHYHLRPWIYNCKICAAGPSSALITADILPAQGQEMTEIWFYWREHGSTDIPSFTRVNVTIEGEEHEYPFVASGFYAEHSYDILPTVVYQPKDSLDGYEWNDGQYLTFTTPPQIKGDDPYLKIYEEDVIEDDYGLDIPWDCCYIGQSGKELYVHYQWSTNADAFAEGGTPEHDQVQTIAGDQIPFGETAKIRFRPEDQTWYVRIMIENYRGKSATSQVYIVNCFDPGETTGVEVGPSSPSSTNELGNVLDWSASATSSVTLYKSNALANATYTLNRSSTYSEGQMKIARLTDGDYYSDAYAFGNYDKITYTLKSPHTLYSFRVSSQNWGGRRTISVSSVDATLTDGTVKRISPRGLSYDAGNAGSITLADQNGLAIAHGVVALTVNFGSQQNSGVHYSEISADATPEGEYLVDAPPSISKVVALDDGSFNCCLDRSLGGQRARARVYAYYTDSYISFEEYPEMWTGPYPVGIIEENDILESFDVPACRYVRLLVVPLNEDGTELRDIAMKTLTAFTDEAYRFTGDSQRRALCAAVHRERDYFNAVPVDAYVGGNGMYASSAIISISTPIDDPTAPVITNTLGVALTPPQVVHARLVGLKPNTRYATSFNTKGDDLGVELSATTPPDRAPDNPISDVNSWHWARWDTDADFVNRENPFPGTYNCAGGVKMEYISGNKPYSNKSGPFWNLTDRSAPRSNNAWDSNSLGVYYNTTLQLTFMRYQHIRGVRLWTYNGDGRACPGVTNVQYLPLGSSTWKTLPYTRNLQGSSGIGNVITLKPLKDYEFLCTNAAAIRIYAGTSWNFGSDFMCWKEFEVFGTIADGMSKGELEIQEVTRRGTEVTATILQLDKAVTRHANIYALWGDAPATASIDDWDDYQFVGEMREGDRMATVTFQVGKKTGAIRFVTVPTLPDDYDMEYEALASWSPTFYLNAEENETATDPIISFANIYPPIAQGLPYTLALDDLGTGASFADLQLVSVRTNDGYTVTNEILSGGWDVMRGRRDAVAAGLRYDRDYTGYFICTNDIGGFARYPADSTNDFVFTTAADDFSGPLDTSTTNWWEGAGWTTFTPMPSTAQEGGFKNVFRGLSPTYVSGTKPYSNKGGPYPVLSNGDAPRSNNAWDSSSLGVYSGNCIQWTLAQISSIKELRFWFYNGDSRATLGVSSIQVQGENDVWRTLPHSSYTYGTSGVGNMAYFRTADADWLAYNIKAVRVTFGGYSDFHCCQEVECWGRPSVGVRRAQVAIASFLYDPEHAAISYRLDRSASGNATARANVYACYGDTGGGATFAEWEHRVYQGPIKANRTTFSGRVTGIPTTTTNIRWALVPVDDDGTEFPELTSWTETRYLHDQPTWADPAPSFSVVAREQVYATSARWATELFAWGIGANGGRIMADFTTDPDGFSNETFTSQELAADDFAFGSQQPTLVALNPSTTYYVRLYAVNDQGERSEYSEVETFTTIEKQILAGSVTSGTGVVTNEGADTIVQFKNTGTATFTVTSPGYAEMLVIGGGGGGGGGYGSGGGGKGATFSYRTAQLLQNGAYTVTVGAGGAARTGNNAGYAGAASSFGSVLSAAAGAGGDSFNNRQCNNGGAGAGGAGTSGYNNSQNNGERLYYGKGGDGGVGKPCAISGVTDFYCAGGGGGSYDRQQNWEGMGGHGGGGRAYSYPYSLTSEHDALANTGAGGGGGRHNWETSGKGGSGTVILRFTPEPEESNVPAVSLVEVMGDVAALEVEANVISCGGDRGGSLTLYYGTDPDHLDHTLLLAERLAEGIRRFDIPDLKGERRYFCKLRFTKESGGYVDSRILSAVTTFGVDGAVDPGAPRFRDVTLVTNRVDYTELSGYVKGVASADDIKIAIGTHLETMLEMDCGEAEIVESYSDGYAKFRVFATTNLVPRTWYVAQVRCANGDGRDGSVPVDFQTHQLEAAICPYSLSNLQDVQNTSGYRHDDGRDIQFEVCIGHLGSGENILQLWIGDTSVASNMTLATSTLAYKRGDYNVHWIAPDWSTVNKTRYFQFRLVHTFEGVTYTKTSEVRSFQLRDARTYAWSGLGPSPKLWSDPRNWKSSNSDCYGFPTYWSWVQFDGCPEGTVDTCVLDRDQSIYMFKMNGTRRDITITSDGPTRRTISMWPNNNYYNPGSVGIWEAATSRLDHVALSVSYSHGLYFNNESYLQLDNEGYLYQGGYIDFNRDRSCRCTLELRNRSYFQFPGEFQGYHQYGPSHIIIDDSTFVSTSGNFYWSGSGTNNAVMIFRGKNPVARLSDIYHYDYPGYFNFEVPIGGFAEPPYQGRSGGSRPRGTNSGSTWLRYRVCPNSPALSVPGWTETQLFEHVYGLNGSYIKISGEGSGVYMQEALGSNYVLSWAYGSIGWHCAWNETASGSATGIKLRFCAGADRVCFGAPQFDDLQRTGAVIRCFASPGTGGVATVRATLYQGELGEGLPVLTIPDREVATPDDQVWDLAPLEEGVKYTLGLELFGALGEHVTTNISFTTFSEASTFTLVEHSEVSDETQHGPYTIWTFHDEFGSFKLDEPALAEILLVGGGGAGGSGGGGGGGAGGLYWNDSVFLNAGEYSVTVGRGGSINGGNGGDTRLISGTGATVASVRGGGGGASGGGGATGGSGGGGSRGGGGGAGIAGQGNNGGTGATNAGAGGGGAGKAGANAGTGAASGTGGDGLPIDISGAPVYYAGGGAGCQHDGQSRYNHSGGKGGGGNSVVYTTGNPGADGFGGGGAGGYWDMNGSRGGHGTFIIRLRTVNAVTNIPQIAYREHLDVKRGSIALAWERFKLGTGATSAGEFLECTYEGSDQVYTNEFVQSIEPGVYTNIVEGFKPGVTWTCHIVCTNNLGYLMKTEDFSFTTVTEELDYGRQGLYYHNLGGDTYNQNNWTKTTRAQRDADLAAGRISQNPTASYTSQTYYYGGNYNTIVYDGWIFLKPGTWDMYCSYGWGSRCYLDDWAIAGNNKAWRAPMCTQDDYGWRKIEIRHTPDGSGLNTSGNGFLIKRNGYVDEYRPWDEGDGAIWRTELRPLTNDCVVLDINKETEGETSTINARLRLVAHCDVPIYACYGYDYCYTNRENGVDGNWTVVNTGITGGKGTNDYVVVTEVPANTRFIRYFAMSYGIPLWTEVQFARDIKEVGDEPEVKIFRIENNDGGQADVDVALLTRGRGASTVELSIEWQEAGETVKTNVIATVDAAKSYRLHLDFLRPGREYAIRAISANGTDVTGDSDPVYFKTAGVNEMDGHDPEFAGLWQTYFYNGSDWSRTMDPKTGLNRSGTFVGKSEQTIVPGARIAGWGYQYKHVNYNTRVSDGYTWGYSGYMYMTNNMTYTFGDQWLYSSSCSVNGYTLMSRNSGNDTAVKTGHYRNMDKTGWYPVKFWLGGANGWGHPYDSFAAMGFGMAFNTVGCTEGWSGNASKWHVPWNKDGEEPLFYANKPGRRVKVSARSDEGGAVTADLEFEKWDSSTPLYACWGTKDGGDTIEGWEHSTFVDMIDGTNTVMTGYSFPGSAKYARFFVRGSGTDSGGASRSVFIESREGDTVNLRFSRLLDGIYKPAELCLVYGLFDAGVITNGWTYATKIADIPATTDTYTTTLPAGVGTTYPYARFITISELCSSYGYVTNGLVAHWDAIDNTGVLGVHDATTNAWTDLISGRKFNLKGTVWSESALSFADSASTSYGELTASDTQATFEDVANGTLEMVVFFGNKGASNIALASTPTAKYGLGTSAGWSGGMITASSGTSRSQLWSGTDGYFKNRNYTITLMYSNHLFNDAAYFDGGWCGFSRGWSNAISAPDNVTYIGRDKAGNGFLGRICAIRLYDHNLSSSDVAWNSYLDRVRFGHNSLGTPSSSYMQRLHRSSATALLNDPEILTATRSLVLGDDEAWRLATLPAAYAMKLAVAAPDRVALTASVAQEGSANTVVTACWGESENSLDSSADVATGGAGFTTSIGGLSRGRTYYVQLVSRNTRDGVEYTRYSDIQSITVNEEVEYTWTGAAGDGVWTNILNWEPSTRPCFGYPSTALSTAIFTNDAVVKVDSDLSLGRLVFGEGETELVVSNAVLNVTSVEFGVPAVEDPDLETPAAAIAGAAKVRFYGTARLLADEVISIGERDDEFVFNLDNVERTAAVIARNSGATSEEPFYGATLPKLTIDPKSEIYFNRYGVTVPLIKWPSAGFASEAAASADLPSGAYFQNALGSRYTAGTPFGLSVDIAPSPGTTLRLK